MPSRDSSWTTRSPGGGRNMPVAGESVASVPCDHTRERGLRRATLTSRSELQASGTSDVTCVVGRAALHESSSCKCTSVPSQCSAEIAGNAYLTGFIRAHILGSGRDRLGKAKDSEYFGIAHTFTEELSTGGEVARGRGAPAPVKSRGKPVIAENRDAEPTGQCATSEAGKLRAGQVVCRAPPGSSMRLLHPVSRCRRHGQ